MKILKRRNLFIFLGFFLGLLEVSFIDVNSALAVTLLKQVYFQKGDEIKLSFDGEVDQSQVTTEYINDIIQLSIRDVAVYPAKMMSLSGQYVTKVFAYQYSPKVVRCRFSTKGLASDFRDRFRVIYIGKNIKVNVGKVEAAPQKKVEELNEAELLSKVLKEESLKPAPIEAKEKLISPVKVGVKDNEPKVQKSPPSKSLSSIWIAFLKLGTIFILLGLACWAAKKMKSTKLLKKSGIPEFLGKLMKNAGASEHTSIQVVSKCYLDSKKSLMVARVGNRQFFLGVTPDSIRLISDLSDFNVHPGDPVEKANPFASPTFKSRVPGILKDREPFNTFSEALDEEGDEPQVNFQLDTQMSGPSSSSDLSEVRSRIKNRLEGLKPL